jgi:hypothetical protein
MHTMNPKLKQAIEQWNASPSGEVWNRLGDLGHRIPPEQGETWTLNLLEKFDGDVDAVVAYIHNHMKGRTQ